MEINTLPYFLDIVAQIKMLNNSQLSVLATELANREPELSDKLWFYLGTAGLDRDYTKQEQGILESIE